MVAIAAASWHGRGRTVTLILQVVLRSEEQHGFRVVPRRWVVERTFAWLTQHRRLVRDYQETTTSSEALIYIAMTRLILRRLPTTRAS